VQRERNSIVPTRASLLRGIFVTLLAVNAIAATPLRKAAPSPCQACIACGSETEHSRSVHVWWFNQSRMQTSDLADILTVANRIWMPYGVSIEAGAGADAIKIIVSGHLMRPDSSPAPVPIGDTLFTNGHATPYIHLWLGAAERLASSSEIDGRTFTSRSLDQRDSILRRILGVALAHELGHYLLDTASHSSAGLLRETLGIDDLARPMPGHLRLTDAQQQLMCGRG
jgi:hypothetical protein